jgi:hypothetical protein
VQPTTRCSFGLFCEFFQSVVVNRPEVDRVQFGGVYQRHLAGAEVAHALHTAFGAIGVGHSPTTENSGSPVLAAAFPVAIPTP